MLRDYQTEIIEAVRASLRGGNHRPLVVSPCGSGKTVIFTEIANLAKSRGNDTLVLVHRQELLEQAQGYGNRAVMAQTLSRRIADGRCEEKQPDIIIVDEAHHAQATTWRRIFDYYPRAIAIGFTATPCRLDGRGLGDIFDSLILGRSADELMREGWLCEYDYYAPHTPLTGAKYIVRGSDFDTASAETELTKVNIIGKLGDYLKPDRKTIVYCPTIKYSRQVEAQFPFCRHFDGDTPKAERERIMQGFRAGEIKALTNVDLIGEGVDVPDCDCVILLRPTMSVGLYIQQAMRCLRPQAGKRAVIYDLVGNVYRHGLPTQGREWSLTGNLKCRNPSGEPEISARECGRCFRVYAGHSPICPYCGFDNGRTKQEIRADEEAKLERITALEKLDERAEQGRARSFGALVAIAKSRGYKNPSAWAFMIMRARKKPHA